MYDTSRSAPLLEFIRLESGRIVRYNGVWKTKVCKFFFQQISCCFCANGCCGANTRVFRISVNHDQPVLSHEINCVVNVYSAPPLFRHYPRVVNSLRGIVLVLSASGAIATCVGYAIIDSRPIHNRAS